ncbi:MAG: hypothetical protein WKF58_19110 [Ilumatobacteraceae bacterium]
MRSSARRATRRAQRRRPSRSWVAELDALVQWLPLDVRIPVLVDGAAKLARRLRAAGVRVDDAGVKPKLIRYSPRRRAVLRFGDHIIKSYRAPGRLRSRGARSAAKRSAGCATSRRPPSKPFSRACKLRCRRESAWPGADPMHPRRSEPAGALLAELHSEAPLAVPTVTTIDLLDKAVASRY